MAVGDELPDWMKHALLLALVTLAGCGYAEPEIHLIPDGYVGPVFIVQEWPDGQPERYEEGRRLYEIPADGLLLTQFSSNDGIIDDRYYYVSPSGERREIVGRSYSTIHDTPENRADTTVLIHGLGVGIMGSASVPYQQYLVGTKTDILDRDYHAHGDVFEALQRRGITYQ